MKTRSPILAVLLCGLNCLLFSTGCRPTPPKHGTAFLLQLDTNQLNAMPDSEGAVQRAAEILRRRLRELGLRRPFFQPTNHGRLLLLCPTLEEKQAAACQRLLELGGVLEFRMVHPQSDQLLMQDILEPGYEVLTEERTGPDGRKVARRYLVKKGAERGLTGKYLKTAFVSRHPVTNQPEIDFELNPEGAKLFAEVTREWSPKGTNFYQLAIVLDGVLYSAPRIMAEISAGRGQITGSFDLEEAFELANVLENPIEVSIRMIEVRQY